MAKTMRMTTTQNYDASRRKRINTCDRSGVVAWSDLDDDVLYLVMMRLGIVDFPAFSRVCKLWRSLALSNKNRFMASTSPMSITISNPPISISTSTVVNEKECYMEDFQGRMFKTILPHSAGRTCVGLTCGYLILYESQTRDLWLVNPITKHELHFPCAPFFVRTFPYIAVRAILVFSPSLSRWFFVIIESYTRRIWFCIAGEEVWNHVSSTFKIIDLYAFNGKIYTLNSRHRLCEMKLSPKPKLTLLETKNFPEPNIFYPELVSYGDNLGVIQFISKDLYKVHQLDFSEMKWVSSAKTKEEYAFFINNRNHIAAVKRESWWAEIDKNQEGKFISEYMWYFPHECLNVNSIHEW